MTVRSSIELRPRRATTQQQRSTSHRLAAVLILASLVPLGFDLVGLTLGFGRVELPTQMSPADVCMPALALYLFHHGDRTPRLRFFGGLFFGAVLVVLITSLIYQAPILAPIQSLLYYFKPWIGFFAAYKLVVSAPNPVAFAQWLLGWVARAELFLVGLILSGFIYAGRLMETGSTASGTGVVGFTAGTWNLPIQIYGYGQVNSTGALLFMATPIFAYRASCTKGVVQAGWLCLLPITWLMLVFSGSRGALLCLAVYGLAWIFVKSDTTSTLGPLRKLAAGAAVLMLFFGSGGSLLGASPKYEATLNVLASGSFTEATSGRDQLARIMLDDIYRSPVVGTAFGDFNRFHPSSSFLWRNSSPHNTYLGALHKGGFLVGLGFLALIIFSLPWSRQNVFPGAAALQTPLAVALAVGLYPVLDALTTPVLATTILVVAGVMKGAGTYAEGRPAHIKDDASVDRSKREPSAKFLRVRSGPRPHNV